MMADKEAWIQQAGAGESEAKALSVIRKAFEVDAQFGRHVGDERLQADQLFGLALLFGFHRFELCERERRLI